MSSAPLKTPPSADPTADLDYSVDDFDFEIEHLPDSTFLFQRMEDALVHEGTVTGGRTLDVACGVGKLAERFQQAGGEAWGVEPSGDMLALSRFVIPRDAVALTRGVAETLPFRDATVDSIAISCRARVRGLSLALLLGMLQHPVGRFDEYRCVFHSTGRNRPLRMLLWAAGFSSVPQSEELRADRRTLDAVAIPAWARADRSLRPIRLTVSARRWMRVLIPRLVR